MGASAHQGRTAPAIALVALAACGGFENDPLRLGRVTGEAPPGALIAVLGKPELRALAGPDGRFAIERVPAGEVELIALSSGGAAAQAAALVAGGEQAELGALAFYRAGYVVVRVVRPRGLGRARGTLTVEGTPLAEVHLGADGAVRVGPLPDGCYAGSLRLPDTPPEALSLCFSGTRSVELTVRPAPAEGCALWGCDEGLTCAPSGQCEVCAPGSEPHCPEVTESRDPCGPCRADADCGSGGRCAGAAPGVKLCAWPCQAGGCAQPGFSCVDGACIPDPAQLTGCYAYRQMGASCGSNRACRAEGLLHGVCRRAACTYACTEDGDCPRGFSCDAVEGVCLR